MRSSSFFILPVLALVCISSTFAQERKENKENEETFHPHHIIGLAVTHAFVYDGRDAQGNKKTLALPAWGIDYTYHFRPKWAIGLHTDLIVEQFEVEYADSDDGVLERSYPVAPAVMGIYKPIDHWSFLLGAGMELEKGESFFLNRAGVEYSAELPRGWEIFGTVSYDFKWNAYDTWVLGLGISKALGKG